MPRQLTKVRAGEIRFTGPRYNRWPANHPEIAYVTEDGAFLCVTCANGGNGSRSADDDVMYAARGSEPQWKIVGAQTNESTVQCAHCERDIEPQADTE